MPKCFGRKVGIDILDRKWQDGQGRGRFEGGSGPGRGSAQRAGRDWLPSPRSERSPAPGLGWPVARRGGGFRRCSADPPLPLRPKRGGVQRLCSRERERGSVGCAAAQKFGGKEACAALLTVGQAPRWLISESLRIGIGSSCVRPGGGGKRIQFTVLILVLPMLYLSAYKAIGNIRRFLLVIKARIAGTWIILRLRVCKWGVCRRTFKSRCYMAPRRKMLDELTNKTMKPVSYSLRIVPLPPDPDPI